MNKRNLIWLAYSVLILHLLAGEPFSVFVYSSAFLMELIVLMALYQIHHLFVPSQAGYTTRILIGIIPLLLFNYTVFKWAGNMFDPVPSGTPPSDSGFFAPVHRHLLPILLIGAGILAGYAFDFFSIRDPELRADRLRIQIIKKSLAIWLLGMLWALAFLLIHTDRKTVAILTLLIGRIVLELVWRRVERLNAGSNPKLEKHSQSFV